jgi:hypothetical protein
MCQSKFFSKAVKQSLVLFFLQILLGIHRMAFLLPYESKPVPELNSYMNTDLSPLFIWGGSILFVLQGKSKEK